MIEEEGGPRNYYKDATDSVSGLKFRLDGSDVIENVVNTLRGGVKRRSGGKTEYHEEHRLMNDLGIARAKFFLQGSINKVNHLTQYTNEDRILRQIRSLVKSWVFELTANLKIWAPGHDPENTPPYPKVKNKRLVVNVVENAIYQSMLRGKEGFEAKLITKTHNVYEAVGQEKRGGSIVGGLFGRRQQGGDVQ